MTETHHPALGHHFDDLEQQDEANNLGMWVFLITEVMLFGGVFTAYFIYRTLYPEAFAQASHHLHTLYGGINTGVLLTSSLCVALAVHAAQQGKRRQVIRLLLATIALGVVFLGIKGYEWVLAYQEHFFPGPGFQFEGANPGHAEMFFFLYYLMTALHALHMLIGLSIMSVLAYFSWRRHYSPEYYTPLEIGGLYWHFVDIVWIFLYPLLYLVA